MANYHTPRYHQRLEEWRQKTQAEILDEGCFQAIKKEQNLHVLGVMGFSGRWHRSGLQGRELTQFVADMCAGLQAEFESQRRAHQERLVVCTGATNGGVLQVVYEACTLLGIAAMGITPDRALNYEIGEMRYLLPSGQRFGDESPLFLRTCDAFLVLGGGEHSHHESLTARAIGKPLTIVQGFGGIADTFTVAEFPKARFVQRVRLPATALPALRAAFPQSLWGV